MLVHEADDKFAIAFRCCLQPFTLSTIKDGRYIDVNDAFVQTTGWARQEAIGRTSLELGIWEARAEREKLIERMVSGEKIRNIECRFRKRTGEVFGALLSVEPVDIGGEPCVVANAIEIIPWRRTQGVLPDMSRRLIDAQEQERTFIARELHDDISQRIALLAVGLEQLKEEVMETGRASHAHLCQRLFDLGKDVQSLSHRLHSSKLEYLGLTAAARSFCREFSDQERVQIDFVDEGVPRTLPKEIALCLFRIMQEALHNALKHSGVRHFQVELGAGSEDIHLSVSDSGRGFDPASETASSGLGLTSMRERARMINGELTIESHPNGGTTIHVRAPSAFCESVKEMAV